MSIHHYINIYKRSDKLCRKSTTKSLKLINGDLLADLMITYGIGLEKIKTYTVYKLNEDYFE